MGDVVHVTCNSRVRLAEFHRALHTGDRQPESVDGVPIWIAPGMVVDEAVVQDGRVMPGRIMSINASFDHRFIDGYHAMILSRTLRRVLEHPYQELDPL